jgi:hypothetical protein
VDSRQVAEFVDKQHAHLLRDIDGYVEILSQSNFGFTDHRTNQIGHILKRGEYMSKKKIEVELIAVSFEEGQRIERNWDDIPEAERKIISRKFTDEFMEAAGYRRADQDLRRA